MTLADAALFWVLYPEVKKMAPKQKQEFVNIMRWFDQVQHTVGVRGFTSVEIVDFGRKPLAFTV